MDVSSIDTFSELAPVPKNIIGNLVIVAQNDFSVQKKINRIESEYKDQIISKNLNFVNQNFIIFI